VERQVAAGGAERLAELVSGSETVVALTGAGVSVPSGIPDFRTPETGLWAKVDPMEVAHIDVFERDPARFWSYYRPRFHSLGDKRPNAAHEALAELESRGHLAGVITQNIDRLHRAAGSENVVEVHGSIETSSCRSCGFSYALEEVDGLFDGEGVARCAECAGPVKPGVVLFGELLPEEAMRRAQELAAAADLMLCVGSSLVVHPVAGLPGITLATGGRLAIVTKGPTPYDRDFDAAGPGAAVFIEQRALVVGGDEQQGENGDGGDEKAGDQHRPLAPGQLAERGVDGSVVPFERHCPPSIGPTGRVASGHQGEISARIFGHVYVVDRAPRRKAFLIGTPERTRGTRKEPM
jgi:NAD-dependent deacetylase